MKSSGDDAVENEKLVLEIVLCTKRDSQGSRARNRHTDIPMHRAWTLGRINISVSAGETIILVGVIETKQNLL